VPSLPCNTKSVTFGFSSLGITFLAVMFVIVVYLSNDDNASAQQILRSPYIDSTQNNDTSTNYTHTLSVTGSANAQVKTDKMLLTLGVQTTNKTANTALVTNSVTMNDILNALKAAGVKGNETSTSSFGISPNYNYSQSSKTDNIGKITGFTVSNSIQIQSTNIGNVSKWIDTAIAAGANTVNSVDFTLSNKRSDEIKNSLIKQAIDNARTKADIAASALGLKIVGVKLVNLDQLELHPPQPSSADSKLAAKTPTPIISGQEQVSINVGVTFLVA
jgi:uncharacterized protein